MYRTSVNKKVLSSLILAGCFDNLGYNKKTLVDNLDNILNYAELSSYSGLIDVEKPLIEEHDEYSGDELVRIELDVFGFYLSYHPVSKYTDGSINSLILPELFNRNIEIVLYVEYIREITTKSNEVMAFIKASDEYNTVDLTMFPRVYQKYNSIAIGDVIKVYGRVEKRNDIYQVLVSTITKLNK